MCSCEYTWRGRVSEWCKINLLWVNLGLGWRETFLFYRNYNKKKCWKPQLHLTTTPLLSINISWVKTENQIKLTFTSAQWSSNRWTATTIDATKSPKATLKVKMFCVFRRLRHPMIAINVAPLSRMARTLNNERKPTKMSASIRILKRWRSWRWQWWWWR